MERAEIREKLKAIIEPYAQDKESFQKLTDNTDMMKELKINSAHIVDIILDTEEAFDIEIDNDTAEKLLTFKDVMEAIEQKKGA